MNRREKQWLQEQLARLNTNDRQRLYRQAAKQRKAALTGREHSPARARAWSAEEWEEEGPEPEARMNGRPQSLDDWVLRLLKEEPEAPPAADERSVASRQGRVVGITPGRCLVRADAGEIECLLRPELAVGQQTALAVGDEVCYSESGAGGAWVEEVLPRRTTLSRPDPFYRSIERVVAANIDVVVIVVSVGAPPLHPRLIDRYLIAVQRGGAAPVICVNKIDLLETPEGRAEELAKLAPYHELDIPVLCCSSATGEGVDGLTAALAGKLCVFVGHSGVGKSSLLNALDPALGLSTKTLREGDGKGRHTTTASHLYDLGCGIRVIDTPGIREFGLWKLTAAEVRWYFTEFTEFAAACRFSDCSHSHEPGCAVQRAARLGQVPAARYESYRRILATL